MVKLRVQHNSEDDESMGSEMSSISCSAESLEGINRHPKASSSDSELSTPDFLLSSQDKTSLSGQKNSNQEREAKTGSLSHRSLSFATQNLSSIRKKANFKVSPSLHEQGPNMSLKTGFILFCRTINLSAYYRWKYMYPPGKSCYQIQSLTQL